MAPTHIATLCIVECKAQSSPGNIQEIETQAYTACIEYLNQGAIDSIYAMTTVGTKARCWIVEDKTRRLDPMFGGQKMADLERYVEAHSSEASTITNALNEMITQKQNAIVSSPPNSGTSARAPGLV